MRALQPTVDDLKFAGEVADIAHDPVHIADVVSRQCALQIVKTPPQPSEASRTQIARVAKVAPNLPHDSLDQSGHAASLLRIAWMLNLDTARLLMFVQKRQSSMLVWRQSEQQHGRISPADGNRNDAIPIMLKEVA